MKRIMFVKSSLNGEQGVSTILAGDLIAALTTGSASRMCRPSLRKGLSMGDDERRQALDAARNDIVAVVARNTSEEVRYANA